MMTISPSTLSEDPITEIQLISLHAAYDLKDLRCPAVPSKPIALPHTHKRYPWIRDITTGSVVNYRECFRA